MIGQRFDQYEILAKLGAGGMGEVYRARDSKLGRDVAIKVLPSAVSADRERLTRFEREARTLASLNHPNIAQVYDAGTHASVGADGSASNIAFLVMELVDGEDLTTVIARGPVPLTDALGIARQIASALEAAHESGIIHRDLKPANIKVRPDGTVKVLDFGLAKALGPDSAISGYDLAHSPTITSPATAMGMILGTAAYMSPEQARGRPVDRRADVWAFGVVLYEMLTGRRAFDGPDVSDVLASVLKDTLPLDAVPAETPASIRRLLRRCLHKDRNERLDSMATARLEIADALAADRREETPASPPPPSAAPSRNWWPMVAVVAVVAGLAGWAGRSWSASARTLDSRVLEFAIPVPGAVGAVAITPDGSTVIVQSDRLYRRRLSEGTVHPIPGTDGARNVSISPDGKWAAFYSRGKILKVGLAGGDPLAIADADYDSPGVGWGPDNTLIFSPGWNSAMVSVSADGGGTPRAISTVDLANGELSHWWPQLLPDGKSVLFTIWMAASGINDARIGVLDTSTGKHRIVGPGAFARYTPLKSGQRGGGRLIYFHAGVYHSMPFDLGAMKGIGDPVLMPIEIMPHDPGGNRNKPFAVSDDGTLTWISGPLDSQVRWVWTAPSGGTTAINLPAEAVETADLTADGRWLVTSRAEGGLYTIGITDLARETRQKLTLPGSSFNPSWSPDGRFFLFTMLQKGHFDIWRYVVDDGRPSPMISEPLDQYPVGVTNDGTRFVLEDSNSDGTVFMTHAPVDEPAKRTRLGDVLGLNEIRFSPDDKWFAEETIVEGRSQIVVRAFPSGGAHVPITPRGGSQVLWPRTGSRIFYQRGDEIVSVKYSTTGGRFVVDSESVVFRLAEPFTLNGVAPDGRFLLAIDVPGQVNEARVTLNCDLTTACR